MNTDIFNKRISYFNKVKYKLNDKKYTNKKYTIQHNVYYLIMY